MFRLLIISRRRVRRSRRIWCRMLISCRRIISIRIIRVITGSYYLCYYYVSLSSYSLFSYYV